MSFFFFLCPGSLSNLILSVKFLHKENGFKGLLSKIYYARGLIVIFTSEDKCQAKKRAVKKKMYIALLIFSV